MGIKAPSPKGPYDTWILVSTLPIGPIVVPFRGSYLESYKVIPKRNYQGAYGYARHSKP